MSPDEDVTKVKHYHITPWRLAVLGAYLIAIVLYIVTQNTIDKIEANREAVSRADSAAAQAKHAADRAEEAISDVQASRKDQCYQANDRFRRTMIEIRKQVKELPPSRRKQAEAQSENTRKIIRELTGGNRNCSDVVR